MRKIKFRGKRHYDGKWVYGCPLVVDTEKYKSANIVTLDEAYPNTLAKVTTSVDFNTLGQFTGLYDKNGKEIYEGDIVEHPYIDPIFGDLVEMKDGKGVKSVVVFHEGAFCVRYGEDVFYYLDQFTRHNHIEVIGNIHDHTSLIEKGGEQ